MKDKILEKYRKYLLDEDKLLCDLSHYKTFESGWDAAIEYIQEQNSKLSSKFKTNKEKL